MTGLNCERCGRFAPLKGSNIEYQDYDEETGMAEITSVECKSCFDACKTPESTELIKEG